MDGLVADLGVTLSRRPEASEMNAICDSTNAGCGMEWLKENGLVEGAAEVAAKKGERTERREAEPLRVLELEMENFRLNKLVAELLLKNQELRRAD